MHAEFGSPCVVESRDWRRSQVDDASVTRDRAVVELPNP
jgi:hypothetical protein